MSSNRTSSQVRRLLEGPIDSFEKLELVLALLRADKPLTVASLARMLALEPNGVRPILAELSRSQLVVVEASGTGEPGGPIDIVRLVPTNEDGEALDQLAKLYDDDRVLVVRTISSIALDRIRGMAARTFADAFQFRKKGRDDG